MVVNEEQKHDWWLREWSYSHPGSQIYVCRKCGVIRRADGENKPCKGIVRIGLRDEGAP